MPRVLLAIGGLLTLPLFMNYVKIISGIILLIIVYFLIKLETKRREEK